MEDYAPFLLAQTHRIFRPSYGPVIVLLLSCENIKIKKLLHKGFQEFSTQCELLHITKLSDPKSFGNTYSVANRHNS